jgi:hypothetical protein
VAAAEGYGYAAVGGQRTGVDPVQHPDYSVILCDIVGSLQVRV